VTVVPAKAGTQCRPGKKTLVSLPAFAGTKGRGNDGMRLECASPTEFIMPSNTLPSIEIETAPDPTASVIWLHGLGADGNDFVPIIPELRLTPALPVRFVFPHAPVRKVTINNGVAMRAWYDIAAADLNSRADIAGVRQSQAQVEALIAREASRGVAASRIVLAGFSQGGVIALHTAIRHPERLAGVVALSTYLVLADKLGEEAAVGPDGRATRPERSATEAREVERDHARRELARETVADELPIHGAPTETVHEHDRGRGRSSRTSRPTRRVTGTTRSRDR